jgi:hypothetical protein
MYRDDEDALRHRLAVLDREAATLERDNEAMRKELLARRSGGAPVFRPDRIYEGDLRQLSPGERVALSAHQVTSFPVWAAALLHFFTFGLFSLIHFGQLHDRLPKATSTDPSAGKAIGYSFIPYFNFYWVFFNSMRLCERLNLQFALRGERPIAPRGLMLACSILTVIPYINLIIGIPLLWTLGVCFLQSAVNRVAELGPLSESALAPGLPPGDPYAQPPTGLLPP